MKSGVINTLLLLGIFVSAKAQISGVVSEADSGETLPGSYVYLKGSQTFTTTDGNGFYQIAATENDTIVVSFTGFRTHEEAVGIRTVINVSLREDNQQLDEVVVIGYGVQRRRELTGAVANVSAAQLEYSASTSVDALLSGAVAGVNVTQSSGLPGAAASIRIRGGNSVNASNEPLYVIDGFIFFSERNATQAGVANIDGSLNPLSSINPADIASIEILKDVSAKAIYGSRGANGVILITTKKGRRNSNNIRYQYTAGMEKPINKLSLMNAPQWVEWAKSVPLTNGGNFLTDSHLEAIGKGTEWQNAVLQTGVLQKHELSVSGGDETTRYLISGNYTEQQGIVLNSGFERFSGRINLDRKLNRNLTVGFTGSADRSTQNALSTMLASDYAGSSSPFRSGITNSLVYALFMPPVLPIYNDNGSDFNYNNPFELSELQYYDRAANPVSDLKNSIAKTIGTTLLANLNVQYDIPFVEGFSVKFNAGTNINYITQNFFAPPYTALGVNQDIQGRASVGNRRTDVTQIEYLLTYTKHLNDTHYVDILTGYTRQKTKTNFVFNKVTHIDTFDNLARTNAPSETIMPPASRSDEADLLSYIGRINYTLLQRYNLTATFRADKSSRFSAENEWGFLPSIGLSWNITNNLKLRTTYGKSGNQEIGFNDYAAYFNAGRYNGESALEMTTINNPDLKWENTSEYNIGVDANFWKNRITLVFDVYSKATSNLLMKVPPPLGSPTNHLQTVNLGSLTNKGFEVSANGRLIEKDNIAWSVNVNFARNINRIADLGRYNNLTVGSNQEQILREGDAVGSFYGYIFDGVAQLSDDLSILPTVGGRTPRTGDVKLRDIEPDGRITPEDDRTIIGSIHPKFTYGFSTTLNYRRWDMFLSFNGSQGNKVYNKLRRHLSENNSNYNRHADLLNAWTENNPSNSVPRWVAVVDAHYLYSRYVEDASYLRLKTLTVGYIFDNVFVFSVRLFTGAQNLFTLTSYKGYDPEIAEGIDTGVYPVARSFYVGVSASF